MTMGQLRGKAVRSVTTACVLALMLAATPALAQTAATNPASAKDADIDAFLANLQRTSDSARTAAPAAPPAEAAPSRAQSAPAPALQQPTVRSDLGSDETVVTAPNVAFSPPAQLSDDAGPFRTLLLMLGGIAICALATVGLTLTFFALRKDIKKKRRARQRRFVPYPPKSSAPVAQA